MAVPPLVALKAAGTAQKSLTGDMFVRRTSKVVGKGKNARVVEDTFHLNPTQLAVGAGITAIGLGLTAWVLQLKIQPSKVVQRETIVDSPGIPAYDERVPRPEVGHWADNVIVVGKMDPIWIGDTYIKGVLKPGHWITPDKVQTVPGQHWVVDVATVYDIIPHAAIPAVTHRADVLDVDGNPKFVRKYAIEQRRGFSMSETLEDLPGVGPIVKGVKQATDVFDMFTHPFGAIHPEWYSQKWRDEHGY